MHSDFCQSSFCDHTLQESSLACSFVKSSLIPEIMKYKCLLRTALGLSQGRIEPYPKREDEWVSYMHSFSPSEHLDYKCWGHQKMSPDSNFEWPDVCPVGMMSVSEGGAHRGDNIKRDWPLDRPAPWSHFSRDGYVLVWAAVEEGSTYTLGQRGSLPGRAAFHIVVWRCDERSASSFSEPDTLEQKGQTEYKAFGVHWICQIIFRARWVQDFPKCVLPSACALVSIKGSALWIFLIRLPWNDKNMVSLRSLKARKVLIF